ncbi:MAG TPA: sigma-54 dependent transcriptional regulator [Polyangiaceae bacterium]|nr:sigma-54 dependent transcriptional regulator [Polyangiaceae bacterium]
MTERILVVDDAAANVDLLADLLEPEGYQLLVAATGEQALEVAFTAAPSLILLDMMLPDLDGCEVCRRLKANQAMANTPVIFITARDEPTALLEAFRAGGVDYITKPFHRDEVVMRVKTHLALFRLSVSLQEKADGLARANETLRAEIARREQAELAFDAASGQLSLIAEREAQRWNVAGFVGQSATMAAILESLRRVRDFATTTVLITGESGTGKELVARAIHSGSSRARRPFVPVNCSAVPAELMESLFFGHRRGAFTGADRDRKGYFELAQGGTLFLDEVGDMPLPLQAKLLRVLEDGKFLPVGASEEQLADVRVVAATNANLERNIAEGRFRQDLFYRLARFSVRTPPLRERPEDIQPLAEHFLRTFGLEMSRKPPTLGAAALDALLEHDFPGNVRELKNVIERALIECRSGEIAPGDLALPERRPPAQSTKFGKLPGVEDLPLNLEAAEQALIERALSACKGNVAQAARLLGVPRMRIYRRMGARRDDAS